MLIVVDGTTYRVAGGSLLQALRAAGIDLPGLCHDDRLRPLGGCRLCLVRLRGAAHPVAACTLTAADGMAVEVDTPELGELRREMLALLGRRYPAEAIAADPEHPFHRLLRRHGVEGVPAESLRPALRDDSHPFLAVDLSRCIDCYRCVRICAEVQGQFVWQVFGRGEETRVGLAHPTLVESGCVSCGACADTCPTGAIADRTVVERGRPERWTRTTCGYCGVGCEMEVGTRDGKIVQVSPALDSSVARGHLCVKGRYAFSFGAASDRPLAPRLRDRAGSWREVGWDEAIGWTAERLRDLVARHGPEAVGVLGSARATNEENYLTQKFARVALGTNNVDCCARVCHAPSAAGLARAFGTGAATGSFADLELARTLMVVGANCTESHPVVGARIRQAARAGAYLIVVDPRRTELARCAEIHLRPRPGTNVPLLQALACVVVQEGLTDEEFVARRTEGLAEYAEAIREFTPERAAEICGVPASDLRAAARRLATARPATIVHGLGVTEHVQGTDGVTCLANLALLTGNVGRPGAGLDPLRGQNNVQGSAHMGCEPSRLTGYQPLAAARRLHEEIWGVAPPGRAGLNWMEMLDAASEGRLKGLYAIGYDVLLSNPQEAATRRALERLELLVVQDPFAGGTAEELAHVFLPVATFLEKDGTFMNAERRVQRVRAAARRPPGLPDDAQVLARLAATMGHGERFAYAGAREIWDEVRRVWPAGAGISYERLERGGLQWPCPDEAHPGTERLHVTEFAHGDRARLRAVAYLPTQETTSAEFPFLLTTGRALYAFNVGSMTARTAAHALRPTDLLEISVADADRLGIGDGELVRLRSRWGETEIAAAVGSDVEPGVLFATFHSPAIRLNRVTGPYRDAETSTPEYKVTAVAVTKLRNSASR